MFFRWGKTRAFLLTRRDEVQGQGERCVNKESLVNHACDCKWTPCHKNKSQLQDCEEG